MLQIIQTWVAAAKVWIGSHAQTALDTIDQLRLLTPTQSTIVIVVLTFLLAMPVAQIWLRRREVGYVKTILACLAPAIFLEALLQVPSGFIGVPDDNCEKYANGKLTYALLTFTPVPKDTEDIYGEGWVILLVRSNERWGSDTHQCRLSLDDPKVKDLMDHLKELQWTAGVSYGRGNVTFTFGGRNEVPNVKVRPLDPDPKTDPPEVPKSQKHNI